MTIDEAIKQNQATLCVPNSEFMKPKFQAIALGNEALKHIRDARLADLIPLPIPLPGETEN